MIRFWICGVILFCSFMFSGCNRVNISRVEKEGKWGWIDKNGNEFIECVYDFIAFGFEEGMACVELNGKYGLIDKEGKVVLPFAYSFDEVYGEVLSFSRKYKRN